MDDITKIVNSLKESGLLVKGVRETKALEKQLYKVDFSVN